MEKLIERIKIYFRDWPYEPEITHEADDRYISITFDEHPLDGLVVCSLYELSNGVVKLLEIEANEGKTTIYIKY